MKKALKILAIIATVMVTVLPLAACGDSSKTQSELDLLKETIEELTDRLDELATANGELADKNEELSDRIDALNVFTTDEAEYNEHETMTIYFRNTPVLKIRCGFDNLYKTPLFGGFNFDLYLTSLCADINSESILGTMLLDWDNGSCVRRPSTSTYICRKNIERNVVGSFLDPEEAYANGTWFDFVICVPGTPFELARFKNVSFQFN